MRRIRLIQCGMGGMGRAWWHHFLTPHPDFELVAAVDVAERPLGESAEALKLPPQRCFNSLEAALSAVQADAVLTVTPPPVHVEHARLAFAAGLHLLSEKPLADTLDNARLMAQLADKANRQLVVAQNYRYRPAMQKLRALVQEQIAGPLGHGHIDFYIPADFGGSFRRSMEYVLLVDMAIHHLDLIRFVTGRNIVKITAQTFRPTWATCFDHQCGLKLLMELEGGVPFSYSGDWSAKGRCTSWNGSWRLQCAEGSIHLEDDGIALHRCDMWNQNPAAQQIEIPEIPLIEQAALLKEFAEAIRSGRAAPTSGQDNLWSFGAVMAAVKSAREGTAMEVPPLIGG